jgi:shikimate dehydrogenase
VSHLTTLEQRHDGKAQTQLMTTTEKKRYTFGLLGERVDYSRSPEIFQSIFAVDDVCGSFEIINCSVENLSQRLAELRSSGYDALSVTIPHKEAIVPFLEDTDNIAGALRSVNSVKFTETGACGLNTDCYGFAQPLAPYAKELKGKSALILGAGGAARSVAYSLALDCEIAEIQFCSRSAERLKKSASMLTDIFPRLKIRTGAWKPTEALTVDSSVAIVVNATPLGGPNAPMSNVSALFAEFPAGRIFYDLNYNGDGSMKAAAQKRCRVVLDGLPMLIHQALRSYYLWTGSNIQFDEVSARIPSDETD